MKRSQCLETHAVAAQREPSEKAVRTARNGRILSILTSMALLLLSHTAWSSESQIDSVFEAPTQAQPSTEIQADELSILDEPPNFDHLPIYKLEGQAHPLEPMLYYLEDPSAQLTLRDIRRRIADFRPLPNESASFGFSSSAYWFAARFDLPTGSGTWVLNFPYGPLAEVSVHTNARIGARLSGSRVEFARRFKPYRQANFEVPASTLDRTEWLIYRVVTDNYMYAGATLYREATFAQMVADSNRSFYFALGTLLALILVTLVGFLEARRLLSIPLLGYLGSWTLYEMTLRGSLAEHLLPNHPEIAHHSLGSFGLASLGSALLFAFAFCRDKLKDTALLNITSTLGYTYLGGAVFAFFIPFKLIAAPLWLGTFIVPMLCLVLGIAVWRKGTSSAIWFCAGWSATILVQALVKLAEQGVLTNEWLIGYGSQIATASAGIFLITAMRKMPRKSLGL